MEDIDARRIIESLLFVHGQPLSLKRIVEVIQDVDAPTVRRLIDALNDEYVTSGHAFKIQEVGGGYQLVSLQEMAPWIKRALQGPKPDSVSTAALETLAIVAYRQPITKAEIEAIRGVDVGAALDTLVERRFVKVAGRKESPGRPFLYGTTPEFLRHFGLRSLDALPSLDLPTIQEQTEAPAAEVSSEPQPAEAVAATETVDAQPEPQP